jgi:hypothetical protein
MKISNLTLTLLVSNCMRRTGRERYVLTPVPAGHRLKAVVENSKTILVKFCGGL